MDFFNSAVDVLQTLVIALGAGLGIWGGINLMEGYGNDNPGANTSGSDHTALSDGNAATNHYVGCQPAIILYGDGFGIFQIINASIFSLLDIPFFRQKRMHGSCQCDIWPDHHIVPDMDFTYI